MAKAPSSKFLNEKLDHILREIEKLKAQEVLILDMIREVSGEPKITRRTRRSNVKQTVLDLSERSGAAGLNAVSAVDTAASYGVALERGTVSSLLSRLKHEGIVDYDGSVYRLVKYKTAGTPNVHPLRTSGTPA